MGVKAVFVDAGGVLVIPDPERVASVLAPFGATVDAEVAARGHFTGVAALTRVTEGDRDAFMPYHHAYVSTCAVSDAHLDDAVSALADEFLRTPMFTCVLPGAVDALRALTEQDVHVAILSNSGGYAQEMLQRVGVCQVGPGPLPNVDAVFDSGIIGYEKPDPRIFEHALRVLGVRADEAIHVGDTPAADVDGAVAAGIRPILIDPLDVYADVPHTRVGSLVDVISIVSDARVDR